VRQHRARRALDSQTAARLARVLRTALAMKILTTDAVLAGLRRKRTARRIVLAMYSAALLALAVALLWSDAAPVAVAVFVLTGAISARPTYVFLQEPCPNCQQSFSSAWFLSAAVPVDLLFRGECEHCRASIVNLPHSEANKPLQPIAPKDGAPVER
jgi:hypothetical protein